MAALVVGIGAPPADARPIEKVPFDVHDAYVVDDYCGDLEVGIEVYDRGHYSVRSTGPDGLPRFSSNHHGSATHTNVATGKAFTITFDYSDSDVRVTNNDDGTFTILFQVPGHERFYGPDGQHLFMTAGTIRIEAIVDHGGTPSDPSDDLVISEELVADHLGQQGSGSDWCDSFRTLTG
jgi:hypothetical protein